MRANVKQSSFVAGCVLVGLVCIGSVRAQDAEPVAVVSFVGGDGAARTESDELVTMEALLTDPQELTPGQGIRTFAAGTATILIEASDTVIFLGHGSEVQFAAPTIPDSGVGFVVEAVEGTVSIVQSPQSESWLAVAERSRPHGGYTISRGASLVIDLNDEQSTLTCTQGEVRFFSGRVPSTPLVDGQGAMVGQPMATVAAGERFDIGIDNARPVHVDDAAPATADIAADILAFASAESGSWLARAEQGDFTPVRGAGRGAPEPLAAQLDSDLAFDQPRPVLTPPSLPNITPAVRNVLNPSQGLVALGIPGTVVAGQRFRMSRILGNPGTSTNGGLTVNSAAEQLIRLR